MANRNLFPVKRLSPSNAFLSAAEGHLSLCICFRPFVWDGETTETSLNIDLYNVLPSPYPRDLAGLQRTFGDIENGFADEGAPAPECSLDGSLYSGLNLNQDKATKPQTVQIVRQGEATPYWFKFNPLYLGGKHHPVIIRGLSFLPNRNRTALTLMVKGEYLFEFEGLNDYADTPFTLNAPLWSNAV